MSAERGGATPNPQVRREEVIFNDIKLLSSLSPAASACLTYRSTADPLTSQLQTRGMCSLMHSVAMCVCVCVCVCMCVCGGGGGGGGSVHVYAHIYNIFKTQGRKSDR